MKVICSPAPDALDPADGVAYAMYTGSNSGGIGRIGASIPQEVRRAGLSVDPVSWDFLSIALAVIAADEGCLRDKSPDGWTRQMDVSVSLLSPEIWQPHADALAAALGFLTGDIWSLTFKGGGRPPPEQPKRKRKGQRNPSGDIVCLMSGGLDSLVGAIDLVKDGRSPIFVSQRASGDTDRQRAFASRIGKHLSHLQLSHAARPPGTSERSQRARSIVFLAFGVLAATAVPEEKVQLVVPENGFISMNVPLTNLRIGSLSTRTTHPYFLRQLQSIWDGVGLNVELSNPYQLRTKGEMLQECREQDILVRLASTSTSCGRFARYGYKHCGRCVPCLVRRAAFKQWGQSDKTEYKFSNLAAHKGFDDVRSLAIACLRSQAEGVERWASGAINFAEVGPTQPYLDMVARGLEEARQLLTAEGVF